MIELTLYDGEEILVRVEEILHIGKTPIDTTFLLLSQGGFVRTILVNEEPSDISWAITNYQRGSI